MVAIDLFDCGMDIERVNIVINLNMPEDSDSYLASYIKWVSY